MIRGLRVIGCYQDNLRFFFLRKRKNNDHLSTIFGNNIPDNLRSGVEKHMADVVSIVIQLFNCVYSVALNSIPQIIKDSYLDIKCMKCKYNLHNYNFMEGNSWIGNY